MLEFLQLSYFGVRLWIWIYLVFSIGFVSVIIAYWQREQIRKLYYTLRYPEKAIKIIIHYESGLYRAFWRIVPSDRLLKVDKKHYIYDKELITKEHEIFIAKQHHKDPMIIATTNIFTRKKGKKELIYIDGKEYDFKDFFSIKEKGKKYPELHYFYNNPFPIKFDTATNKMDFTSSQLKEFVENDLFGKLLSLKNEKTLMLFLLLIVGANLIATVFIISKMMGWIK